MNSGTADSVRARNLLISFAVSSGMTRAYLGRLDANLRPRGPRHPGRPRRPRPLDRGDGECALTGPWGAGWRDDPGPPGTIMLGDRSPCLHQRRRWRTYGGPNDPWTILPLFTRYFRSILNRYYSVSYTHL